MGSVGIESATEDKDVPLGVLGIVWLRLSLLNVGEGLDFFRIPMGTNLRAREGVGAFAGGKEGGIALSGAEIRKIHMKTNNLDCKSHCSQKK